MVAILLPTAGERLDVVLKCLLGASSQRSWPSSSAAKTGRGDGLRVIVLDEKRRKVFTFLHMYQSMLSTATVGVVRVG